MALPSVRASSYLALLRIVLPQHVGGAGGGAGRRGGGAPQVRHHGGLVVRTAQQLERLRDADEDGRVIALHTPRSTVSGEYRVTVGTTLNT